MDLKLADLLRYYLHDSQACKDLLYRRSRSLANYENANKELDKARAKGKNIHQVTYRVVFCFFLKYFTFDTKAILQREII